MSDAHQQPYGIVVYVILSSLAALFAASGALASDVDSLLRQFANMPGFSAEFREEKRMSLLLTPLLTSGSLYFSPPHLLARHTHQPTNALLVIDDAKLYFGEEGKLRSIDLATNPVLKIFVDSFRSLLAGEIEALRADFSLSYNGETASKGAPTATEHWELDLKPLRPPLSEKITLIGLRGTGSIPEEMRVREAQGDETITRFSSVDITHKFSEAERSTLFRLDPP